MAAVCLAEDLRLRRHVAIKVMAQSLPMPGMVERFQREAYTMARLDHPNIVPIYDVGVSDDLRYIVMRHVPGRSLAEVLSESTEPIPLTTVRLWLSQLASALRYAHTQPEPIVHRDIKPPNVLLNQRGDAMLTDFGIAHAEGDPRLTRTGLLVGTPAYMSPEQCQGLGATALSDQYALGTVGYELITGSPPFTGPTLAVIAAHVQQRFRPLLDLRPDCPRELCSAVERMLEKNPADRWPTMADAISAIGPVAVEGVSDLRQRMIGLAARAERVRISIASTRLTVGETSRLTATVFDSGDDPLPGRKVEWVAQDPDVLEVASDGTIRAIGIGSSRVLASSGGKSATLDITVESAARPSFDETEFFGAAEATRRGRDPGTARTPEPPSRAESAAPPHASGSGWTGVPHAPTPREPAPPSEAPSEGSEPPATGVDSDPGLEVESPTAPPDDRAKSRVGDLKKRLPVAAALVLVVAVGSIIMLRAGPEDSPPGEQSTAEPLVTRQDPTITDVLTDAPEQVVEEEAAVETTPTASPSEAREASVPGITNPEQNASDLPEQAAEATTQEDPEQSDVAVEPQSVATPSPPPAAASLRITSTRGVAVVGDPVGFQTELRDERGGLMEDPVTVSSRDAAIFVMEGAQSGRAAAPGNVWIVASAAGLADSVGLSVEPAAEPMIPTDQPTAAVPEPPVTEEVRRAAEGEISAEVRAYVEIITSGDPAALVQMLGPGVPVDVDPQKSVLDLLQRRGLAVENIAGPSVQFSEIGDRARAEFSVSVSYRSQFGGNRQSVLTFEAVFLRTESGWRMGSCRPLGMTD